MDIETYLEQPLPFDEEIDKHLNPITRLTIFEVGTCEGEDTIKLRWKFPNAEIYAFEPLPKNIRRIKANYKKYEVNDIHLNELALSDRLGKAKFFVSSGHPDGAPQNKDWDYGNKSSSLLPPKEHKNIHKWVKFNKSIEVKTGRLDQFCEKNYIDKIDFLYLDVQGAELKVLEGAGDFINNISLIWMEVEAVELYEAQPLKKDVEEYMESHGFIRIMDTVEGVAGDQLYINKRLRKSVLEKALNRLKRNSTNSKIDVISINETKKMLLPEDMGWTFEKGKYYEENVLYWLNKIADLYSKPTFYDIGANYGYYTLQMSEICEKVYAFEPVPSTFSILKRNVKMNGLKNIVIANQAIGSKNGTEVINIYNSSGNNSLYQRQLPKGHPVKLLKRQKIKLSDLSNYIKSHNASPPHIMKVDVEGAEMDVLKGSSDIIKKYQPSIIIEYSVPTSRDAGYDRVEVLNFLNKSGYKVYGLAENAKDFKLYNPASSEAELANLIAVPDKFKLN